VDRVRLRSLPSVDTNSVKYVPLLPEHTLLLVLSTGVSSSGYWWYQVELVDEVLSGGIVRGWVAAADHDGTPWVAYTDVDWGDSPRPIPDFSPAEVELLAGVRPTIGGCEPLRQDLLPDATAAIACRPAGDSVERVLIVGFARERDMLAEYRAQVATQGIVERTHNGQCRHGVASEGAYVPGDEGEEFAPYREACFVDERGQAHYLATIPRLVLVDATGPSSDMEVVRDWAWLGNQDEPGGPTVCAPTE
jgi:hypothetical protein